MDNPRILAVDTAANIVSAAVLADGKIECSEIHEQNCYSETIIGLVDEALAQSGLTLKDIDVVAFGAGPGAFTGLRVACGVAQGLAWAADKPVAAASNLEAAALHLHAQGVRERVVIANDARMNECYTAAYAITDAGVEELAGAQLVKPEMLGGFVADMKASLLAGSAEAVYRDAIALPEGVGVHKPFDVTARHVALVARELARVGKLTTAAAAAPLYVRNHVALTIEDRKRGEKL